MNRIALVRRRLLLLCAVGFAVYALLALAGWLTLPGDGFWITDQGVKYLQARMIATAPDGDAALRMRLSPAEALGMMPMWEVYLKERIPGSGRWYLIYPELFARLAALPLRAGASERALTAIALLAGLAATLAWIGAAWRLAPRSAPFLPVLAVASPILFYHWVFWEHTLALACVAAHLWLVVVRRDAPGAGDERPGRSLRAIILREAVGGLLLGAACWLRPETMLYGAAIHAALLATAKPGALRRIAPSALAFGILTVAMLLRNHSVDGHFLGLHYLALKTSGESVAPDSRLRVLINLFCGTPGGVAWMSAVAGAGVLAMLTLAGGRFGTAGRATAGLAIALVAALLVRVQVWGAADPFAALLDSGGLGCVSPLWLAGFGLAGWRASSAPAGGAPPHPRRTLLLAVLLYFVAAGATCPPVSAVGIHWGPRMLLVAFPALGLLAADALARVAARGFQGKLAALLLAVAVGIGAADSLVAHGLLRAQVQHSSAVDRWLAAQPEGQYIATTVWWVPLLYSRAQERHTFLYLRGQQELPKLQTLLRKQGIGGFLFVTPNSFGPAGKAPPPIEIPGAPHRSTMLDAFWYRIPFADSTAPPARSPTAQ